jgi:hypothetical protein
VSKKKLGWNFFDRIGPLPFKIPGSAPELARGPLVGYGILAELEAASRNQPKLSECWPR